MWGILFIILIILLLYDWITMKPRNFPPGPFHFPLVGCVPFIRRENFHLQIKELGKHYGSVIGIILGHRLNVAVTGAKEVLNILKHEDFQCRPDSEALRQRTFGQRLGIIFNDGPAWQELRRFSLRHMRDFGFGKSTMEHIIADEVDELMEEIQGNIVEVNGLFNLSAVNVLWAIMAGKRFYRSDVKLKEILDTWTYLFRSGQPSGIKLTMLFPFLKHVAPVWSGHQKEKEYMEKLQRFVQEEIAENERTLNPENSRGFIDDYLLELKKENSTKQILTEKQLIATIFDLFGAGSETSGNTLSFAILFLVLNPDKQKLAQQELDAVIGRNRAPMFSDRPRLPYIEAVIAETMRFIPVAPFAVPHSSAKKSEFCGYSIPKGTFILVNLYSLLHDEEHWGDPDQFRPERFLDENGKFQKDDWLLPFGLGKRVCLGEPLARMVIFLFLARMLHKLSFRIPKGAPMPSAIPLSGFSLSPRNFKVKFKLR